MIRIPEIRVIDENGEQLGVMATDEARKIAEERDLDLVEIAPNVRPPVCKIMDFGKYKYEQSKKLQESKKKQHVTHLKEIKLRPKIEKHDLMFKMNNAEKFLEQKDKVKFTVIFRGREMEHLEKGYELLNQITERFSEIAAVERTAVRTGRIMSLIMGPRSDKSSEKKTKKGGAAADAKDKD
ncbi:MAG: translation initiation factor IF-3 [Bacteroidales bacterium]|nr:translation initiation factor IF-3 [Candidatus Latescibacterota bacterium]